jgi:hypothetical protein
MNTEAAGMLPNRPSPPQPSACAPSASGGVSASAWLGLRTRGCSPFEARSRWSLRIVVVFVSGARGPDPAVLLTSDRGPGLLSGPALYSELPVGSARGSSNSLGSSAGTGCANLRWRLLAPLTPSQFEDLLLQCHASSMGCSINWKVQRVTPVLRIGENRSRPSDLPHERCPFMACCVRCRCASDRQLSG